VCVKLVQHILRLLRSLGTNFVPRKKASRPRQGWDLARDTFVRGTSFRNTSVSDADGLFVTQFIRMWSNHCSSSSVLNSSPAFIRSGFWLSTLAPSSATLFLQRR